MAHTLSITRRIAAAVLPLFLLASCASTSTSLKNVWEEPSFAGGPFKRIIVFGLGADGALSHSFEDIFAAELKLRGVEGIPGHTLIAESEKATTENIERAAKAAGADGFLVARLVKADRETRAGAGSMPTVAMDQGPGSPTVGTYNSFYGYYGAAVAYTPPVTYQYEVVTVETDLWDARSDKRVWSATSQTFAPGSVTKEAPGFARVILDSLAKRGLVPAKK
jgi:hypothetical protein